MRNIERPTDANSTDVNSVHNVNRSDLSRGDVSRSDVSRSDVRKSDVIRGDVNGRQTGVDSQEYLKGYRDGVRDRQAAARPRNGGDGILGALLAIALLAGVGYFGYSYVTTGRLLPAGTELNNPFVQPPAPQS